eukprot:3366779-Pleurochrysis_carterae.AAC.1
MPCDGARVLPSPPASAPAYPPAAASACPAGSGARRPRAPPASPARSRCRRRPPWLAPRTALTPPGPPRRSVRECVLACSPPPALPRPLTCVPGTVVPRVRRPLPYLPVSPPAYSSWPPKHVRPPAVGALHRSAPALFSRAPPPAWRCVQTCLARRPRRTKSPVDCYPLPPVRPPPHKTLQPAIKNLYADSASATYMAGFSRSVAPGSSATVLLIIAAARASACTRGRATTRSASGTKALTPSTPPQLELVVTLGFS